jgi:Holliday junction resolvase RusA-like endonuclease
MDNYEIVAELFTDPMGKPRMTQRDKWKQRDVVLRYYAFKDAVNLYANSQNFKLVNGLAYTYVIPMPKSWSKKKRAEFNGRPHQQKPDIDNLEKALFDSLLKDDSVIWYTKDRMKVWGEEGKIIIYR